ncbi:MAG: hypothetical protein AAGE90_04240 [Pseudomonadota bacterium]
MDNLQVLWAGFIAEGVRASRDRKYGDGPFEDKQRPERHNLDPNIYRLIVISRDHDGVFSFIGLLHSGEKVSISYNSAREVIHFSGEISDTQSMGNALCLSTDQDHGLFEVDRRNSDVISKELTEGYKPVAKYDVKPQLSPEMITFSAKRSLGHIVSVVGVCAMLASASAIAGLISIFKEGWNSISPAEVVSGILLILLGAISAYAHHRSIRSLFKL